MLTIFRRCLLLTSTSFCQFLLNGEDSTIETVFAVEISGILLCWPETEKLPGKQQTSSSAENDFQLMK